MHIFLDDIRDTPPGWVRTYTVDETINMLASMQGRPDAVSLDNDLGYKVTEGYMVARWIEEKAHDLLDKPDAPMNGIPLEVIIHTANSSAAAEMRKAIEGANRALERAGKGSIRVVRPYAAQGPGNALYNSGMWHPWVIGDFDEDY